MVSFCRQFDARESSRTDVVISVMFEEIVIPQSATKYPRQTFDHPSPMHTSSSAYYFTGKRDGEFPQVQIADLLEVGNRSSRFKIFFINRFHSKTTALGHLFHLPLLLPPHHPTILSSHHPPNPSYLPNRPITSSQQTHHHYSSSMPYIHHQFFSTLAPSILPFGSIL